MIVKRKQFIFLGLVRLQLLFENYGIASNYEILRATVVAGIVLGHELFDSDAVRFINNVIFVVGARAVCAFALRFFNIN